MSLIDFLRENAAAPTMRLHMPGHHGQGFAHLPMGFADWDITEIDGADNFHAPDGIIDRAQKKLAAQNGFDVALLCTCGATAALQAALLALCPPGGRVLLPRTCHKSVIGGLVLCGGWPVWLAEALPTPEVLDAAIARETPAAVVLTSPLYTGELGDIIGWGRVCRERGVPLILDAAHGAHLLPGLCPPGTAAICDAGAAAYVVSCHKTLPAPGQTALLCGGAEHAERLAAALRLVHTTSPSYPLMAGAVGAYDWLFDHAALLAPMWQACGEFWAAMAQMGLVAPVKPGQAGRDITRLTVFSADANGLNNALRDKGFVGEGVVQGGSVYIASAVDDPDTIRALTQAVRELQPAAGIFDEIPLTLPEAVLSPREAFFAPREWVPLAQALGRIAAASAGLYPPGVPLVMPGEQVTVETAQQLRGVGAFGVVDGGVWVVCDGVTESVL